MRTSFSASLLAACLVAAPAFAQTSPAAVVPAPQPTAVAPAIVPGAPVEPLTKGDTQFVTTQLEGNMAEIKIAQLALQDSQDQPVRDYAQKMITDHTAANDTLMAIANRHGIQAPVMLTAEHQHMFDRLSKLTGARFDRTYIDGMVTAHEAVVKQMNAQLIHGQNQQINAWVQNTRPTVIQHAQMAQQIKAELPRMG